MTIDPNRNVTAQQALFAARALLPDGWSENVRIEIDAQGMIATVRPDADSGNAERADGPLLPGMPNLHSHAFQRAMAGRTQRGGPGQDSFRSWREQLYRFVERLNPDHIETIATQLYIEMLQAGFTSVAEFHYLHHDADGQPHAEPAETSLRILAAAERSGIGITLLPVFYAHAGFGGAEPLPAQRRFVCDADGYARIVERLARDPRCTLGFAPHSLRAVTPGELNVLLNLRADIAAKAPVHIHAAEQKSEVQACLEWSGMRPIEWLLANAPLDRHWCLVHATHMTDREAALLARCGSVVGLCPSTEADLGDGLFRAEAWRLAGGRYGIGSDSQVAVDPFAELRLFEYGQRLQSLRRNAAQSAAGASVGAALYRAALAGGAASLGQPVGRIAAGCRADFVVLDTNEPALAEQDRDDLLDAAIFGPCRRPVRHVMVCGRWQVRNGRHALCETSRARYRETLRQLPG
jgi:formimidoylglutamate deiminase